jgi:hypothetical protein
VTAHTAILVTRQTLALLAGHLADLSEELVLDFDGQALDHIYQQLLAIDVVAGALDAVHEDLLTDGVADDMDVATAN